MVESTITHQRPLPGSKETGEVNKRIVCWIGDAPNHRALATRLAAKFDVAAIVIDKKRSAVKKTSPFLMPGKILDKIRFSRIDNAWKMMQDHYRQSATIPPGIPVLIVNNINDRATMDFTMQAEPALVVVSGTSLIREPLIELPVSIGVVNLHTGLSPYVKGGPNCTNWCISNNEWGLIGNTIMWISSGIDSGNIIATEKTNLENARDLPSIHLKVMQHAHDLYERTINYILNTEPPYTSVAQSEIAKGKLYLTKMWTAKQKKQLLKNLHAKRETGPVVKTISLPS